MPYKPKVLVDFDGVIHQYSKGWDDGSIYDPPISGAQEALIQIEAEGYEVVIFSTRDAEQIVPYLAEHGFKPYRVTNIKEPAICQIDDRAIHFVDWHSALCELSERYLIKEREC